MTITDHYGDNQDQGQYWNELSGPKWVEEDKAMNIRMSLITDWLLKTALLQKNQHVLDVGCGGGATTELAAKAVGNAGTVDGLDISKPLLKLAKARCDYLQNVSFILGDAQSHQLKENYYNHVISRFGVMFFAKPQKAFNNLRKSLQKDGKLSFACWSTLEENEFFHVPLNIVLSELNLPKPEITSDPGPMSLSNSSHIRGVLKKAGFRDIHVKTIKTKMSSPDSINKHAKLYLKIGPGAKIMGENKVSETTFGKILKSLKGELKKYRNGKQISLEATIHCVTAKN